MKKDTICYSPDEYATVLMHIEQNFGEIVQIYSGSLVKPEKLDKPFIELDLCLIAPTPERNYYSFVTVGFGAFKMPVPDEYKKQKLSRAEFCFALPPETNFDEIGMENIWPMRMMNLLIYYSIKENLWLGWGNTFFDGDQPFSENTKLGSILLVSPGNEAGQTCVLPDGDDVNFYCLLPLYKEEVEYVRFCGPDHLIDRFVSNDEVLKDFKDIPIINDNRPNVCLAPLPKKEQVRVADVFYIGDVIDYAGWHKENIEENNLPVDPIQTYNHMAIYLRFAIENGLMSENFKENYPEIIAAVLHNDDNVDLREFLRDEFLGCLLFDMFNDDGFSFASYYYNKLAASVEEELHSYTADIDIFAKEYFKDNWQYLPEQKRYAYLFIPYNEAYYRAVYKKIEQRYKDWRALYESEKKYIMS